MIKQIIFYTTLLVIVNLAIFLSTRRPIQPPIIHVSMLHSQSGELLKEGDHIRTTGYRDAYVRYGQYEGKEQFYTEDETGDYPLSDWSNQPKETWSVIIP